MDSRTLELWVELKQMVENMEKDMQKNAVKHNVSAGIRVRAGLRSLRRTAAEMLKVTLVGDKETVEIRKNRRTRQKTSVSN